MTVIQPCPFCAGPGVASAFDAEDGALVMEDAKFKLRVSYEAYVWCHTCGAQGPRVDPDDVAIFERREIESLDALRALAVESWNSRCAPLPIEGGE